MHSSSFDNKYVIIACCEDICCRLTSKKITFLITSTCPPTMGYYLLYWMKISSFSVVYNKQPLPRFLALANLFTFLPPVKPLLSHIATAVMIIPYFDDNIAWL